MDGLEAAAAWGALHDPQTMGGMDAEAVLKLAKRAGYSEDEAQTMAGQQAWERMKRELPP